VRTEEEGRDLVLEIGEQELQEEDEEDEDRQDKSSAAALTGVQVA